MSTVLRPSPGFFHTALLWAVLASLAVSVSARESGRPESTGPRAPQSTFVDSGQALGGEMISADVALGDLDGDGDLDAVVAGVDGPTKVYFNQGGDQGGAPGDFVDSGKNLTAGAAADVELADLDGDSDLDAFVVKNAFGDSNEVWINQGIATGVFSQTAQIFGDSKSTSVALGDLDGAGGPDAFVGRGFGQPSKVWLNDGSGAFGDSGQGLDKDSQDVALGDVDGDGDLDAFSANGADNRVWFNQAGYQGGTLGIFQEGVRVYSSTLSLSLDLGDLDGDGDLDAWIGNSGADKIWVNQGGDQPGPQGLFEESGQTLSGEQTRDLSLADLDGDGDLDAFLAKAGGNEVWINQGGDQGGAEGLFANSLQSLGDASSEGLALGDVDGDGDLDAFVANWLGPDKVWLNQADRLARGGDWQLSTVATRGNAGLAVSTVVDQNGHAHLSYVEHLPVASGIDYSLYYAYWDGVRWHREFVDQAPFINAVEGEGGYTSLALDSAGNPHIAYAAGDGDPLLDLKYARRGDEQWQIETVEGSGRVDLHVALALDANDRPRISYRKSEDHNHSSLMVASWDAAGWRKERVDGDNSLSGRYSDLVLDDAGNPHISYYDATMEAIRYAHHDGYRWLLRTVDDSDPNIYSAFTSIALNSAGNPAVAYNWDSFGEELRYAEWDGASWQIDIVYADDFSRSQHDVSLAFDAMGTPHIAFAPDETLLYTTRRGANWARHVLDDNGAVGSDSSMELDSQGNPHIAYYARNYGDLRYVHWGPDWEIRPLNTGAVQSPAVQVYDREPSIGYYEPASGQVSLARWAAGWDYVPADFVGAPAQFVDHAAGFSADHVSYYDADSTRLMYGRWDGAAWTMVVVDETADVGQYNDLELVGRSDGAPRIAYWDATFNRVKAALLRGANPAPTLYTNHAGPPLNADSGYTSLTTLAGGMLGVSYYDGVNDDLRFATVDPDTGTWLDELVDGAGDVGRPNDSQTDGTDGYPVVAYYDATTDAIKLAYHDGAWQIETVVAGAGGVRDLALELGLGSRTRARIAYSTNAGDIKLAALKGGAWEIEIVEVGGAATGDLSLDLDDRAHLAYEYDGALHYAFRSASLDVANVPTRALPPQSDGSYNPLDACEAGLGPGRRALNARFNLRSATGHDAPAGDLALFAAMSDLFRRSAAGQRYIDLYRQHGSEMGRLGLEDPALMWDAYGALQNFLPGLEALVTGRGDEVLVTQQMVDDALDIWQRLAAAGSPALAGAIDGELARYDNLQAFVGMSFDQWAREVGVATGRLYLPLVARD